MSSGPVRDFRNGYNEALPSKIEALGSSTSLTNIETSSDAWGKSIPYTWGLSRVAGVLIWASPYYKTLERFRTTTQFKSVTTWRDPPTATGGGNDLHQTEEVFEGNSSLTEVTSYYCDCAYSVGFEGDTRKTRDLLRLRINGTVVYDADTGFVQAGIAFNVRVGSELEIDPIMLEFAETTGKFYYPGQTYIIFDKLPLGAFGNAMPQSVDAEFKIDDLGAQAVEAAFPTDPTSTFLGFPFISHENKRAYFLRHNLGANGLLQVYDLVTSERYDDIPLSGPGVARIANGPSGGLNNWATASVASIGYIGTGGVGVTDHVAIDLLSGYCANVPMQYNCVGTRCFDNDQNVATFLSVNFVGASELTLMKTIVTRTGSTISCVSSRIASPFGEGGFIGSDGDGVLGVGRNLQAFIYNGANFAVCDVASVRPQAVLEVGAVLAWKDRAVFNVRRADNVRSWDCFSADGSFLWTVDALAVDFNYRAINVASGQGKIVNGIYGQASTTAFFTLDLRSGATRNFDFRPDFPNDDARIWCGGIRQFFAYKQGSDSPLTPGSGGLYGPDANALGVSLVSFLQSLYVNTRKFTLAQITGENVTDEIAGAIIVGSVDVDKLADDICFVYRIEKRQDGAGVRFYRDRSLIGEINIRATIDVSELALLDEETGSALETSRKAQADVPAALTIRFVDKNNEYKTNEVTVRNPDTSIPNTATRVVSLPIVMSVIEANTLAINCINDMNSQAETHRFRLPPMYSYLQSRDIIKIVHGKFTDIIRITQDDFGGDFSVDCEGETVIVQVRADVPTITLPDRDISAGSEKPAKTIVYVIDAPLLYGELEPAPINDLPSYIALVGATKSGEGRWSSAYIARRESDGLPSTLFNTYGPKNLYVLVATNALTDKRLVMDDTKLTGQATGNWDGAGNRTRSEIDADAKANLAYYGKPGRWEIVQFERIVNGEVFGIVRGLRGTELNCGKHQIGDLFIVPQYGTAFIARSSDKVGVNEIYRAVTDGAVWQSSADSYEGITEGNSLRPFIPASITAKRGNDGAITIAWDRRDRVGTSGWGTSVLPETDGPLSYIVKVYSSSGVFIRTFASQTGTSLIYPASWQSDDGIASAPVVYLSVQAIGKLPGFVEMRAYNV